MANRLTGWIVAALVAGLAVGWAIHAGVSDGTPASAAKLSRIAGSLSIGTTLFLRLIRMIIAPLVFSTLVVGIAHLGDPAALGRMGLRALGWFVVSSLVSLGLGLALVTALRPGVGLSLPLPPAGADAGLAGKGFDLAAFVTHVVPDSMVAAMAGNEILQIVVFSVFVGVAVTSVGERAAPLVRAAEALAAVMLRVTDYVMRVAPVAVFSAVAATLAERGPEVIGGLAAFLGDFYLGLALLWAALLGAGFLVVGRRTGSLIGYLRQPLILAFTTASSEAAFPRTLEALDRFGVPPRIASFVLPLGYSFNLTGSMMYMTFASIFIAQAYHVPLSGAAELTMLLTLMVTSKGVAGVPRAALVVVAATLPQFGIPAAGLVLVLAVDHFLDMGRTATNVVGNAVAASVIARWEGRLEPARPMDPAAAGAHLSAAEAEPNTA